MSQDSRDQAVREWNAQSLRVSFFPADDGVDADKAWRALFESDPDSQEVRAKENVTRLRGVFLGNVAQLVVSPVRVDLFLSVPEQQQIELANPRIPTLTLGSAKEYLNHIKAKADALTGAFGQLSRVALGGSMLLETGSNEESYKTLATLVKSLQIKSPNMREVTYRVNWRKSSASMAGSEINRITVWNALAVQMMVSSHGSSEKPLADKCFVQLELDINNVPGATFGSKEASKLLAELVDLANENLEVGEVVS